MKDGFHSFNNARPKPQDPDAEPRHVIDEYDHKRQRVTCVCGWRGSSALDYSGQSAWKHHLAEFRSKTR